MLKSRFHEVFEDLLNNEEANRKYNRILRWIGRNCTRILDEKVPFGLSEETAENQRLIFRIYRCPDLYVGIVHADYGDYQDAEVIAGSIKDVVDHLREDLLRSLDDMLAQGEFKNQRKLESIAGKYHRVEDKILDVYTREAYPR